MTTVTKTRSLLILLAAAAAVAVLLIAGGTSDGAPPDGTPPQAMAGATDAPPPEPMRRDPGAGTPAGSDRIAVDDAAPDAATCPQGATGRVVDPSGTPVAGTPVYLMESTGTDLFRQMMLMQQGVVVPPVARAETDQNGRFALAVTRPDAQKKYEIRVVSDRWVDHQIPSISVIEGQWWDAGVIQLEVGAVVYGRVTIEGGGLPVPGARVMLKANALLPGPSAMPGREDGLVAEVDHAGAYRSENVPLQPIAIAAVAPGYARIEKQNIVIEQQGVTEVNFELPHGASIGGVVTDATGAPIANVALEAHSMSSKTPIRSTARSEREGAFKVIGLVDGPYMLTAVAPGYVRTELKPVQAGDQNVQVVLEMQGSAKLRVIGKNGRPLMRYMVTVKKHIEGQEHFGNTDIPRLQAQPDKDHVYTVTGLNPDSYVFQIEADAHAKAFSDPVAVKLGEATPFVEVRLNEGGALEGTVVDDRGQPLRGVKVETLPDHLDENPFTKMFEGMIPFKITRLSTETDANGEYRFTLLAPGPYQLKFTHADRFDVFRKGNAVEVNQTTTVPPQQMLHGTEVSGTVRVDGAPAGQVKVTLSSDSDPNNPTPLLFSGEAITDNEGTFRLGKRVPPGTYQVMAARQTLDPFQQIADYGRTRHQLSIAPSQPRCAVAIAIASQ